MVDKNSQFSFKNSWFSTFTMFLLHSWSSVDADFCISSAYGMSGMKRSLFLEHSSLRGGKQKKHVKNMKFWPYNKRSDWKTSLAERFSEALTSKLWNKKKYCQNWIIFTPYGLIKNLLQIHSRDSHMEFTGKNKVGNTTWTKLCGLIGRKRQSSFQ